MDTIRVSDLSIGDTLASGYEVVDVEVGDRKTRVVLLDRHGDEVVRSYLNDKEVSIR